MANEKIVKALEAFLDNKDVFADAVVKSTVAGFRDSGFSVELLDDESYCLLWNEKIGNRYEPKGRILSVPKLSDEDYRDLCEFAGSSDPDALAHELTSWLELLTAMAQTMRDGLADDETMREEWAEEVAGWAPEYRAS